MIRTCHAITRVGLFVSASLVLISCERNLTVATVSATLEALGPRAALETHFPCGKYVGTAYPKIASGSAAWISLGERMLQHSDGCYTEGIQASLGQAMVDSAENVLPLVNTTPLLAAERICLPFISSELPLDEQRRLLAKSKKSIADVVAPSLNTQKEACLSFISEIESRLE